MSGKIKKLFPRRRARVRYTSPGPRRQAAAFGIPLIEAHLCPGDRRRQRQHARGRFQPGQEPQGNIKTGANKAAAVAVGKLIAERAKAAGVTAVVFDRGGYLFQAGSRPWPTPPARAA